MKKTRFYEPGCMSCDAYQEHGLSRYCNGFKNKKRSKAFRKRDPIIKVPAWCPKRKNPSEVRVYSCQDERYEGMTRLMEDIQCGAGGFASPMVQGYCLRAKDTTTLTPSQFFERANDSDAALPLEGVKLKRGDVIEIDTGLVRFFFYYAYSGKVYRAFFDVQHLTK